MEKRKDKRFSERNRVFVRENGRASSPSNGGRTCGHTHNISISGVQIRSRLDYPVGHVIQIVIDLSRDHKPLSVEGRVVWSRPRKKGKAFDIGVEFMHNKPDTIISLIKNFYGKPVPVRHPASGIPASSPIHAQSPSP